MSTTLVDAPGQRVCLSHGITHFELSGPPSGQTVVLIHGVATPYFVWDATVPALVEAGLQVLRYDLYGRGYSAKPDVDYTGDLFVQQLAELLNTLSLSERVDVLGISLGGMIAPLFTACYPQRVRRLGLIAPGGVGLEKPPIAKVMTAPRLGEWMVDKFGERALHKGVPKMFGDPARAADFLAKAAPHYQDPRFRRAYLSTARHLAFRDISDTFRQVNQNSHPVLLLWGREDKTVPFENHSLVMALLPNAEFHPLDGANHIPPYEMPEVVNPILVEFFTR